MSEPPVTSGVVPTPPPIPNAAGRAGGATAARSEVPVPARALRRLFLTLFLRGRSSRGLRKEQAPRSIGSKLWLTLAVYGLMGMFGLSFLGQPVFALSVYLHAMTLVFLGMFIASSAGEVLFNKEEADILMHRPITARSLLWAKISVLVQVSVWLAGAFNLIGLFVGLGARDGGWMFPVAHALSTVTEALFCTGLVVLTYQLCLRWFGRERLESLMTTAQVFVAIAAVLSGQLVPQLLFRSRGHFNFGQDSWWMGLLPPAWFAGFDDALVGSGARNSWILASIGMGATAVVLWLAFGKLAGDYASGLQAIGETAPMKPKTRARSRWLGVLVRSAPLRWWFRDPVSRASFLLCAAYLMRDREVKLRIYPGIAPMMFMPLIFLIQERGDTGSNGFGVAFTGTYLGLIPMLALNLLQYSQQWQAADLFRAAPMAGPAALCDGARRAVLCLLTMPALMLFGFLAWVIHSGGSHLPLLLPGILALPLFALVPNLGGRSVPLSVPPEEAKSASRALTMVGVMFFAIALAWLAVWSWSSNWFKWLLLVEAVVATLLYVVLRGTLAYARLAPME